MIDEQIVANNFDTRVIYIIVYCVDIAFIKKQPTFKKRRAVFFCLY